IFRRSGCSRASAGSSATARPGCAAFRPDWTPLWTAARPPSPSARRPSARAPRPESMRDELRRTLLWIAIILLVIVAGVIFPRLFFLAEIAGREFFVLRFLLVPAALIIFFFYV